MKVLIADDDPMWRKVLEDNVRGWDYEVVTAENGQQAWDILQGKEAPRVALLDWQMPQLDGIDVCSRIRQSLHLPLIYTIILTSRDTRDDMVIGLESGADDYLVKPVDMTILRTRLAAAVRIVKAVPPPRQIPGYKLIGRLGAGAMATVYKARQLSLDRLVAVKVLLKKPSQSSRFVERFYAEGRAAAMLNHPNIVAALDVGRQGNAHYFVMEYVEGHSAYEWMVKEGAYPEAEALAIGIQIAGALEHAHKAGLIHRDVKPKNILITREGVAKLADMGLARAISDREAAEAEEGKACGTPYYISPEQIRGDVDVDYRADIYNFGATLYHMVTGRVPFEAKEMPAILRKHLREPLLLPNHIKPGLSDGICRIIEVCMAKDRTRRYDSTSALIEDLRAVAQGQRPAQADRVAGALPSLPTDEEVQGEETFESDYDRPLAKMPLFWIAIAGWVLALLLGVLLFLRSR